MLKTESFTFCNLPFTRIRITSEGDVGFCCIHNPIIGNIVTEDFETIWNGPVAENIRKVTKQNKLHSSCSGRNCPYEFGDRQHISVVKERFPTRIDLDLPNTHCNIGGIKPSEDSPACIMCPRSSAYFRPEEDRVLDICRKIKPYIKHVSRLHVQGIAEVFWKGRLFEVLDALDFESYKDKVEFSTFTNGTIFHKNVRDEYMRRCPISTTYMSIDAATDETYRKIRIVNSFNKVVDNFIGFGLERGRTNKLVCANNINIFNVLEVEGMIDIAYRANVDWIEFNSTDANDDSMLSFVANSENMHLFQEAEKKIVNKCSNLGMRYCILKPLDTPARSTVNFVTLNQRKPD